MNLRRNALALMVSAGLSAVITIPSFAADAPRAKTDPANGVTDSSIRIGWMGDETGPGASVELPNLAGILAYADYINAKGGILGKKLQVIHLDDKFTADNGAVNFRRLVNDDKVLAIANMGGSQITTPLAPAILAAKVPIVFPVQTIDAQLNVPYFFNITSHFADQADVLVASAAKVVGGAAKLKMFVARLSVPSGEEFDQYIQRSLKAQGGQYAGNTTISGSQNDYTPNAVQIKQAMDAGANYVVVHGPVRTGLGLFTALSRNNIAIPVGGIQALAAPDIFTKGPKDVISRFTTVQSVLPATTGVPGAREMLAYVKANPKYANDALEPYFAQGWLTGQVIKEAAERASSANAGSLTRETLFRALKTKIDTGGLSCQLDFTTSEKHYTPCATAIGWDGKGLVAKEDFGSFGKILQKKYGL